MANGIHWENEYIVRKVIILIHPSHFVYTCVNLHEIPHGDDRIQDKAALDVELDCPRLPPLAP